MNSKNWETISSEEEIYQEAIRSTFVSESRQSRRKHKKFQIYKIVPIRIKKNNADI